MRKKFLTIAISLLSIACIPLAGQNTGFAYDLSKVFTQNQEKVSGVIWKSWRLFIYFDSVTRDTSDPDLYHVKGADMVKGGTTPFEGTILLGSVSKTKIEKGADTYSVSGHYVLEEDPSFYNYGIYEGECTFTIEIKNGRAVLYEKPAKGKTYANACFDGTWMASNGTQKGECRWGQGNYPVLGDLNVGKDSFLPNPKYASNGWGSFLKALGLESDPANPDRYRSTTAGRDSEMEAWINSRRNIAYHSAKASAPKAGSSGASIPFIPFDGMSGSVSSVETVSNLRNYNEADNSYSPGESYAKTSEEFDNSGRKTYHSFSGTGGISDSRMWEYSSGTLVGYTLADGAGQNSYGASSIGDVVTLSSTSEDCAPKPSKIVYRYSDSGRTMMDSNGNFEQDTFDSEGRITSRSTGEGAGRRTVSYTYDENGLLTGETITKGGKPYYLP